MSLHFPALNDSALEGLASKGVVRRARRDLEAGLARILERAAESARVQIEGHTVTIDARGPKTARCTCPAGGICRHVLITVMALNADSPAASTSEATAPSVRPALAELCALTQAQLAAFARDEWRSAVDLAAASAQATVQENGPSCIVTLPDAPGPVTFIAGGGLAGATFKGAQARARVMVTAAALVARTKRGILLDIGEEDAPAGGVGLPREWLEEAAGRLAQSVRSTLAGAAALACDILFDLAISARAEAVPRLTAELRGLARQARLAATRDVHFEPAVFVMEAARAFALLEALKQHPRDVALTGVPRRDYQSADACDFWLLGATVWSLQSGARGLTMHGFCPQERRWRSVSIARGAGQDPFFEPTAAYGLSLWQAGSPREHMGSLLHLPEPFFAEDGSVKLTLPRPAQPRGRIRSLDALREAGASVAQWSTLRADLEARLGSGLRRRATPAVVLLDPVGHTRPIFNDFSQAYEWAALDGAQDEVLLSLAADDDQAQRLTHAPKGHLLLAQTAGTLERPALEPIALLQEAQQGVQVLNLSLDAWPKASFQWPRLKGPPTRQVHARDPLSELAQRVLESAVATCSGAPESPTALIQACETAGLISLARGLGRMSTQNRVQDALMLAYWVSEIRAALGWRSL